MKTLKEAKKCLEQKKNFLNKDVKINELEYCEIFYLIELIDILENEFGFEIS